MSGAKRIIANWKMGGSIMYLEHTMVCLSQLVKKRALVCCDQVVLMVPMPLLGLAGEWLKSYQLEKFVALGAQKVELVEKVTGGVNVAMLKEVGVRYVCIGHSERRQALGESDEEIGRMVKAVLEAGLVPVVCVGESKEQREQGVGSWVIEQQLAFLAKKDFDIYDKNDIIIAYEPIWSIGATEAASVQVVSEMFSVIRGFICRNGRNLSCKMLVYGGSVKACTVEQYRETKGLSGFLVGRASLELSSFEAMVWQSSANGEEACLEAER